MSTIGPISTSPSGASSGGVDPWWILWTNVMAALQSQSLRAPCITSLLQGIADGEDMIWNLVSGKSPPPSPPATPQHIYDIAMDFWNDRSEGGLYEQLQTFETCNDQYFSDHGNPNVIFDKGDESTYCLQGVYNYLAQFSPPTQAQYDTVRPFLDYLNTQLTNFVSNSGMFDAIGGTQDLKDAQAQLSALINQIPKST